MAAMEHLSTEMLVNIFSHYIQSEGHENFLKNIPRVCKRFNEASATPSLWIDVRVQYLKCLLNPSQRKLLQHTQSLKFDSYSNGRASDSNLSAVLKTIPNLRTLEMESCLASRNSGSHVIMHIAKHCPNLVRFRFTIPQNVYYPTYSEWNQFLNVCGPTLKDLDLSFAGSWKEGEQLLFQISEKCPILEKLALSCLGNMRFPVRELQSGCPQLTELAFYSCTLIGAGSIDSLGFLNLKKFSAIFCKFEQFKLPLLLKDMINLEHLILHTGYCLQINDIFVIPSNRVRILDIRLTVHEKYLMSLCFAIRKWRYTLLILKLTFCVGEFDQINYSDVLANLLHINPDPPLQSLTINSNIDPFFFEKFLQKCQNLNQLCINSKYYSGREEIKEALEFLKKGGFDQRLSHGNYCPSTHEFERKYII